MATLRKRGANRGIVNKKILEYEAMLEKDERKEERLDLSKVRRIRILLQEKMEMLRKLDDDILNEIEDEAAMENDIEDADNFRQRIREAIDNMDKKLDPPSKESLRPLETGITSRSKPILPKLPELTIKGLHTRRNYMLPEIEQLSILGNMLLTRSK